MNAETLGKYCGFFCALLLFVSLLHFFFLSRLVRYPVVLALGILSGIIYKRMKRGDHVLF